MKQLLLLLLSAFATTASAQSFLPILSEGKTWQFVFRHGDDEPRIYTGTVDGDTIVGERNCKRIRFGLYSDAAFEEDGRLYCFGPESYDDYSTDYTFPELICDFNLQVGDSAWYTHVSRVDTIEVRGVQRRRIVLDDDWAVWVEGIGVNWEGWPSYKPVPTSSHHVETTIDSVYENGVLVFTKEDFHAPAISTAIREIDAAPARSGQMYDLSGRAIPEARKNEIYIQDGRKRLNR